MKKGSPEGYNAETGYVEPAQKPQTGEPQEHQSLYRIGRSQEKHAIYCGLAPPIDATPSMPPKPMVSTAVEGTTTIAPFSLMAS